MKYDWGKIGARLLGEKNETTFTFTSTSPYKLFLWFDAEDFSKSIVEILEIKLINSKNGTIILDQKKSISLRFQKEEEGKRAYYSVEDLKMGYENYILQIDFRLGQLAGSQELTATIEFETDFKEYYMLASH
ncbi:MAG: hypothetical protein V6Z89_13610 [Desulfobacter sp.]